MKLNLLFVVAAVVITSISGCGMLDQLFIPRAGGTSVAENVVRAVAPAGGPYGELGLLALMLIQNGYLGVRKYQQKRNGPPASTA